MEQSGNRFVGKRILLGVSGSIAAYKAVELLRALLREGAEVSVAMTAAATKFVAPLTFAVLSRKPVATDLFAVHQEMLHLTLPEQADVFVIAPATDNTVAKLALGLGDDPERHGPDRILPVDRGAGHGRRDVGPSDGPGARGAVEGPRRDRSRTG